MYHYKECGLSNVYLANGYKIEKHEEYGETVAIDNASGLHNAIGLNILENSVPLMSGAEFRFLRIELDLSQKMLGSLIGLTDQTIANYEKGKPAAIADRFIRAIYKEKICENIEIMKCLQRLNELDNEEIQYNRLIKLEEKEHEWVEAA